MPTIGPHAPAAAGTGGSRESATSDLNHAAWLVACGIPLLRATAERARVRFVFDDPEGQVDALLGQLVRDERITRFMVERGRLAFLLRYFQQTGSTSLSAEEFSSVAKFKFRVRR